MRVVPRHDGRGCGGERRALGATKRACGCGVHQDILPETSDDGPDKRSLRGRWARPGRETYDVVYGVRMIWKMSLAGLPALLKISICIVVGSTLKAPTVFNPPFGVTTPIQPS